jgi:hypothetical protein
MSLVLAIAAHQLALAGSAVGPPVPDPPPVPPPIGLTICALMMMVGRRSRSTVAADGAAGIPWVLLGLMLAAASSAIVGVFL